MSWRWHISYLGVIAATVLYFKECGPSYSAKTETTIQHHEVQHVVMTNPHLKKVEPADTPTYWPNAGQIPGYSPVQKPRRSLLGRIFGHHVPDTLVAMTAPIDSATIARLYYSHYFYQDTARAGDSVNKVKAIIKDEISENRILSRSVLFDYDIPVKTSKTVLTPRPSNQFYGGVNIGEGLGFSFALKTKTDKIYDAGYMFNLHGGVFYLSAKWKIKFGL